MCPLMNKHISRQANHIWCAVTGFLHLADIYAHFCLITVAPFPPGRQFLQGYDRKALDRAIRGAARGLEFGHQLSRQDSQLFLQAFPQQGSLSDPDITRENIQSSFYISWHRLALSWLFSPLVPCRDFPPLRRWGVGGHHHDVVRTLRNHCCWTLLSLEHSIYIAESNKKSPKTNRNITSDTSSVSWSYLYSLSLAYSPPPLPPLVQLILHKYFFAVLPNGFEVSLQLVGRNK